MNDTKKLPKWAQNHIKDVEIERDDAIRTLNRFCDNQTVSPIYIYEWIYEEGGQKEKKHYIQTRHVDFEHIGLELNVLLQEGAIRINWHSTGDREGVIKPQASNSINLLSVKRST